MRWVHSHGISIARAATRIDRATRSSNRSSASVSSPRRPGLVYEVTDDDLRITWVSENLERVLGIPGESLVGVRADALSDSMDGDDHATFQAAMAAREPYRGLTFRHSGRRPVRCISCA